MKKLLPILLVATLAMLAACASRRPPADTSGEVMPSAESWDFRDGFDKSEWNVRLVPKRPEAFTVTSEGLQFSVQPRDTVVPGDRLHKKERSEIGQVNRGHGKQDQTNEYSMRFKLDSGGTIPSGREYVIITQSHSQVHVDFPGGWTWHVGVAGQDRLRLVYGLNDGPGKTQLQKIPFPASFGEWHDLKMRVHWSPESDGWAEVFLDGQQVVSRVMGPNMPTADAMEWKFGLYRGYALTTVDTLTVQSVAIRNAN